MTTWKSTLLLLAAVQGILFSLALITPIRKHNRVDVFFGLIIFTTSIELLNAWAMSIHYHSTDNAIPFWILGSYLILPPALHAYFQLNTNASFVMQRVHIRMFIPAAVEVSVELVNYIFQKVLHTGLPLQSTPLWILFTEVIPILWMAWVLYNAGTNLWKQIHQKTEWHNQNKARRIEASGVWVLFMVITLLWVADVFLHLPVFSVILLILTIALFITGYIGYFRPALFATPVIKKSSTADKQPYPHYNDEESLKKLNQCFEEKKIHTQPKLSLEQLAEELNFPPRYVSYLINRHYSANFHHLVNTFRVREFLQRVKDPAEQHKTLLAIALESGFNSKSSFNQIVKAHTGQSPSDYLPKAT